MQSQVANASTIEYKSLQDIDDISPLGNEAGDAECLEAISEILQRFGKSDRLGVTLLHRHFDLSEDEVLMEFCDSRNRVLTTRPMKKSEAGNSIETVWTFPDKKTTRVCYRKCWTNIHGNHETDHNYST